MGDENQMDQGPAVPPQAKEEAKRGVTHVARRRKISAQPQAQWPMNIAARGKEVWDDALHRVRSFQDDSKQYVRRTRRRQSLPRSELVSCSV